MSKSAETALPILEFVKVWNPNSSGDSFYALRILKLVACTD
jgi:hypothetical protein